MSILQPRRADARGRARGLRAGEPAHRLEELPAAVPPQRASGRGGRDGRPGARRARRVLALPRLVLRRPGGARDRRLRPVGGRGRRGRRGNVPRGARLASLGRRRRRRPARREGRGRDRHACASSSTARCSSGAQPLEKFKQVIDAELAKAQAKVASGVARDQRVRRARAREPGERSAAGRRRRRARGHQDRLHGPGHREPGPRQPDGARHDRRVLRLPVPVLRPRRADDQGHPGQVRRQGAPGLEERAAALPPATPSRPPRRRSRCERSRATRRSGRCTTSSSPSRRTSRPPSWRGIAAELGANVERVRRAVEQPTRTSGAIDADLRSVRGLPGQRHPALLHQRPAPGRRAARGQVRQRSSTRRSSEGAGAARARASSPRTSTTRWSARARARPPPETKDLPASLPTGDPARGNANAR